MDRRGSAVAGIFAVLLVVLALLLDVDDSSPSENFPGGLSDEFLANSAEDSLANIQDALLDQIGREDETNNATSTPPPNSEGAPGYTVERIVDGDTLVVTNAEGSETLRLIGVDTPETVHPTQPVECFGKEASDFLGTLLPPGTTVLLESDPSQVTRDRYGRLLVYVLLPDGTNVNQKIIADGYGYEYTYSERYKYQTEFIGAQKKAQAEGRGLWSEGACAR